MLWPTRIVVYQHQGAIPERVREFGVDDYTVMCYKLHLATMFDRLGELWEARRAEEACEGVRIIHRTLLGDPGQPGPDPRGPQLHLLEEIARTKPSTSWQECRDQAWQDTGLPWPLIPWERLTPADGVLDPVADQRRAASDLAETVNAIWAASKWPPGSGPGQSSPPSNEGAVESDKAGMPE
jgi:hypothetical protein